MFHSCSPTRHAATLLFWGTLAACFLPEVAAAKGHRITKESERDKETQELVQEGIRLRRAGKDDQALSKFQRAYELVPTPRHAGQLGLCMQALGMWIDADRFLAEALEPLDNSWVNLNRETLKQSSEEVKAHIARIAVVGSPEGATVSINGRQVGRVPLQSPVTVNEGLVDLELVAEGYAGYRRSFHLSGRSYQEVVIRLNRPETTLPTQSPPPSTVLDGVSTPKSAVNREVRGQSPWAWAGGVVAAAALLGGIAVVLASNRDPGYPKFDDSARLP